MFLRWFFCGAGWLGACSFAQTTPDVGSGSPTPGIRLAFQNAYYRNGFANLVGAPTADVAKFGSTGFIQQFPSVIKNGGTLALIKPDATDNYNVMQVKAAMFAFYITFAVNTVGYPTDDTGPCPRLVSPAAPNNSCDWQPLANNYALFTYASPLATGGQNFAARDPYFTRWMALGGVSRMGPATSAETQVTSPANTQATVQSFDQGAIYRITSGLQNGRLFAVRQAIYTLYVSMGAHTSILGLPVSDELNLANGTIQQNFEGGAIQFDPSTGVAILRPPVDRVSLVPNGSLHMNASDSVPAQVTLYSTAGAVLTDRTVAWNTSNGRVVQIISNGFTATLKAVGGGTAVITATSEGKTSVALTVSVTAVCCQIGEGAPTASLQQAFQDAVTRNKLSVILPASSAVTRSGNGYVQQLVGIGASAVPYLIAVADGSAIGYVVTGAILSQYLAQSGPSGALGYPITDATSTGRQMFQGAALAGDPVQLVTGSILSKWAALSYETGVVGAPTDAALAFLTFRGTTGRMQLFRNALIVAPGVGALSGQAFFVTGLVLAKYNSSGGPGGDLGSPTTDERVVSGLRQQDFEGGYINYATGASVANVVNTPRQPLVTITPTTVVSGTPVHIIVGGFNNGATVRVSQTGQQDFQVKVATGAYAWDVQIPASAASGVVTVRAADVAGSTVAQASYTVRNASTAALAVSIVSGDRQNGAPGAQLAQALVVAVQDSSGNPLPGQTVTFTGSPGALVTPPSAVTGADGQASATLRLPLTAGVALATAQAGRVVVTFSAKSEASSLNNFPALTQAVDGTLGNGNDTIRQKGALLTSAASIVRYHQLRNELPQPNGLADPVTLNQFLKSFCIFDSQGNQICDGFISLGQANEQTANLWRLGGFAGGGLTIRTESTDLDNVRDLVAAGSPVLLALSLRDLGSHFVVATGIGADGHLVIADPNPAFARTSLDSYLSGFTASGIVVQGSLWGAARLLPQAPASSGFLAYATAPVAIASVTGTCGQSLQFPDIAAVAGATPTNAPGTIYFRFCDGSAGPYQLDIGAQGSYSAAFVDLSANGARSTLTDPSPSYQIVRSGSQWTIAQLQTNIAASGVVNAATFSSDIAPGGLISIYGTGFVRPGSDTRVEINGEPAKVIAALPFQVNAQVPFDIAAGTATLDITSGNGAARQSIAIAGVAPAIFSISPTQAAITNQDNKLNTTSNPVLRGGTLVIYGTGFGAVSTAGRLNPTVVPVTVVIGGAELRAAFAGLTPGFVGLYQVNVAVPANLPPGLAIPLYLKQAGAVSTTVTVAIQ